MPFKKSCSYLRDCSSCAVVAEYISDLVVVMIVTSLNAAARYNSLNCFSEWLDA